MADAGSEISQPVLVMPSLIAPVKKQFDTVSQHQELSVVSCHKQRWNKFINDEMVSNMGGENMLQVVCIEHMNEKQTWEH